jgi:hypothetical protein
MDAISSAQATRLRVRVFEHFAQHQLQASQVGRKWLSCSTAACHAVLAPASSFLWAINDVRL